MPESRYTLIVPTFNRPDDLARLLRFLAFQGATFPILVLDSSRNELHERNSTACHDVPGKVILKRFDEKISPWEKFALGAQLVDTEFASLCADDDFVLVDGVEKVVSFLANEPSFSVGHGWYFSFYLSGALGLTQVVYRSPTLDSDDPIERLWRLFARYEAVTYGVHRADLLKKSLTAVQGVQSMLWRELLGGAFAAVAGNIARLPVLYSGRSLGPSATYVNWHPVDFLITSPRAMFEDYARYRQRLLKHCADCGFAPDALETAGERIDLIHLRYLSNYFKPKVLDYLYDELRKGRGRAEIMGGVWPVLSESQGVEGAMHRSRVLRRLRDRFLPSLRGYHLRKFTRRSGYHVQSARTVSGRLRDYHLYDEFLEQLGSGSLDPAPLLETLKGYE